MSRIAPLPVLAALLVLALTACASSPPDAAPPTRAANGDPAERISLSAIEALYDEYLRMHVAVMRGEAALDDLRRYVTDEQLDRESEALAYLRREGHVLSGEAGAYNLSVQAGANTSAVTFYVCLDFSNARLLDSEGNDITPPERIDQQPFLNTVVLENHRPVIASHESWSGANFC